MKVIDLLNKIANGENIPKEIEYSRKYYYLCNNRDIDDFGGVIGMFALNDEIKVLDEDYIEDTPTISKLYVNNELQYDLTPKEDKKLPKKIQSCGDNLYSEYIGQWLVHKENYSEYDELLMNKYNELIDWLNGKDNERN